jgi:homoserine kinase
MLNRIPLARGLGSSAATIVGGLLAAQSICRKTLSENEILQLALKLEEHPDNLVPALVGGLSLSILEDGKVFFLGLPVPLGLQVVMIIPEIKLSTKKARKVLPKTIPFSDAVFNLGRSSLLTAALIAGRYDLLGLAVKDRLHQPYRFGLSQEMKKIFEIASEVGGCGTVVSGAGPSVLTFVNHHLNPNDAARVLSENLQGKKIRAHVKVLGIARQGAAVEVIH